MKQKYTFICRIASDGDSTGGRGGRITIPIDLMEASNLTKGDYIECSVSLVKKGGIELKQ